jgi:hypothetical protein
MLKPSYVISQNSQKIGRGFRRVRHWDLHKSQGMICESSNSSEAATTRNPSTPYPGFRALQKIATIPAILHSENPRERAAMNKPKIFIFAALVLASTGVTSGVEAQQPPAQPAAPQLPQAPNMTFFVISAGPGKGADLGGLEGADQLCLQLAQRHGAGGKTWRAYLSTQAADGKPAVNARDRIGNGPWQNFKGETVAKTVDDLHSDSNTLGMNTSLTERGQIIPGVGFAPNRHDVLTGSTPEGRAFPAGEDRTCRNWTSSTQGAAMLGHIDRKGLRDDVPSRSWNSSHPSRGPDGGCSQADLRSTGGDGLFYCFVAQ